MINNSINTYFNKNNEMSFEEYCFFFKEEIVKDIKLEMFPQYLSVFELIGHFTIAVSQFELKIWNFFAEREKIVSGVYKINFNPKWQGAFTGFKIIDNYIINDNGKGFDVDKFTSRIYGFSNTKKVKQITEKLMDGKWNFYINDVIAFLIKQGFDLQWFLDIRKYRHELVHSVEKVRGNPFDKITNNFFKEFKTTFDIKGLLFFSYQIDNYKFGESASEYRPYNYFAQFLIKNAGIIGFSLMINEYLARSENSILVSDIVSEDHTIKGMGMGSFSYNHKSVISVKWTISENHVDNFTNCIFSNITNISLPILCEIGVDVDFVVYFVSGEVKKMKWPEMKELLHREQLQF